MVSFSCYCGTYDPTSNNTSLQALYYLDPIPLHTLLPESGCSYTCPDHFDFRAFAQAIPAPKGLFPQLSAEMGEWLTP